MSHSCKPIYKPYEFFKYLIIYPNEIAYYGLDIINNKRNLDYLMLVLNNLIASVYHKEIVCNHEFIKNIQKCKKCEAIKNIIIELFKNENFEVNFNRISADFYIKYDSICNDIPVILKNLEDNKSDYAKAILNAFYQYSMQCRKKIRCYIFTNKFYKKQIKKY